MSDTEKPKKRMGRPPKSPEKGRRQNYTFRMSDADRDLVVKAADLSGRSISEEIEARVARSFWPDVKVSRLENQYQIILDHFGGSNGAFPCLMLSGMFIEAQKTVFNKINGDKSWIDNPDLRKAVAEKLINDIPQFVEMLAHSGPAIESYAKVFNFDPPNSKTDAAGHAHKS